MDTNKEGNGPNRSRTQVTYKIVYSVLVVLTGLAYWSVRNFVITQEPWPDDIIVSNLTLNLLLGAMLVGAGSPWLVRKLLPKAPRWLSWASILVAGGMFLLLLKVSGMEMRF